MAKTMTLDVLSSIKGAKSSATVQSIFDAIKSANTASAKAKLNIANKAVLVSALREDRVELSSDIERELIIKGFPKQKESFLVVQKVID